ncbi:sensor histidine kinase [Dactylosporangium sp. McL0621]|uniref:sensor histidine kinase n=1 Tax=Dactylosporangium sp. McL0621 TaxID=3415678 RepID=UPI003CECA846
MAVPAGRPEIVAPRLAQVVVTVLICAYFGLIAVDLVVSARSAAAAVAGLAVLAAHAGLLVPTMLGTTRRSGWLLCAQVVLTYLPVALWPEVPTLWGLSVFLAGSCLVRLRPPYSWLCYAAVSVSTLPLSWAYDQSVRAQVYTLLTVAAVGFLLYAMAWLHRLATDLPVTEARLAAIEVARERRRLLNDAHDVLGFRLSALVLKIELARRGDGRRAEEELAEARAHARAALAEARLLTAERPELSFTAECAAAGALLSAAGIEFDAPRDAPTLPREVDLVLATVLREAATNVVRHSTARRCSIALTVDRRAVRLVVANDGAATATATANPVPGTGLASLTGRVAALGGTLGATNDGGVFTLDVRVPARRHAGAGPATPFVPAVGVAALAAMFAVMFTFPERIDAPFLVLALAFGACVGHLCRPRPTGGRPTGWRLVFAAQVLLAYAPLLHYSADAWAARHYVGGSVLLLFHGRTRWLGAGAILAAEVLLAVTGVTPAATVVYHLAADIDDAVALFALVQLPLLTAALARARTGLAATAVAKERLRFADTLGGRLDERLREALRTLAPNGQPLPAQRLATAQSLARAAAADLRAVAAGSHDVAVRDPL